MRRKNALPISALENADPTSSLSLIAGLCSLALGVIFYFLLRGQLGFLHLGSKINLPINIIFLNSAPSFFHSLAFTSFSVAFGVPKLRAVMAWCLAGFVWESAQGLLPFLGTHDAHDIYASCIGSMCGGIVRAILERIFYQSRPLLPISRSRLKMKMITACFGGLTCIATSPPRNFNSEHRTFVCPIYIDLATMRAQFAVEGVREILLPGRVIISGSKLLVQEKHSGIHVFDNSDPALPVAKSFIKIIGNTTMKAVGDLVYADNFVDLLTLDVSGETPVLVSRTADAFPWNPYHDITNERLAFAQTQPEKSRGVVVGTEKCPETK